jgi:glycosyltransferase involved in cell wall biosynthesis
MGRIGVKTTGHEHVDAPRVWQQSSVMEGIKPGFRAIVPAIRSQATALLRRIGYATVARMVLPRAKPCPDPKPVKAITIGGLLTSPCGIGQGARLCAAALAELGLTVGLVDLTSKFNIRTSVALPVHPAEIVDHDVGGPIVLHLNPPQLQIALLRRLVVRRDRKLIGYMAWEVEVVPASWQSAFRLLHEIWVPTTFVADALKASGCRCPVRVVPHPVAVEMAPVESSPRVSSKLRVLTVFAFDSGFDRKNPLGSVAAFKHAFGSRSDVELIVKARGKSTTGDPERRFFAAIQGADNITVIDRTMTRSEYIDLLSGADIALSLHRSEGFGLVLAEAMLLGKPVVATAWSGNLDFMTERTACLVPATMIPARDGSASYVGLTAHWADPSIPYAANWLRRLEDPVFRALIGGAAKVYALKRLGAMAVAEGSGLVARVPEPTNQPVEALQES